MERFLSKTESLLESLRGEVAEGRMTPLTIVVELDEFENGAESFEAGIDNAAARVVQRVGASNKEPSRSGENGSLLFQLTEARTTAR